eukprot:gene2824-5550_t
MIESDVKVDYIEKDEFSVPNKAAPTVKSIIDGEGTKVGEHHNGNFNTYMGHKISKLLNQHIVTDNIQSNIFAGCAVFVNGYTQPPLQEIRRLVLIHGGQFHAYQMERTTHFICDHLPTTKIRQLKGVEKRYLTYVTTRWFTESIRCGKRLSECEFLPPGLQNLKGSSMKTFLHTNGSICDSNNNKTVSHQEHRSHPSIDNSYGNSIIISDNGKGNDILSVVTELEEADDMNDNKNSSSDVNVLSKQNQVRGGGGGYVNYNDNNNDNNDNDDSPLQSKWKRTSLAGVPIIHPTYLVNASHEGHTLPSSLPMSPPCTSPDHHYLSSSRPNMKTTSPSIVHVPDPPRAPPPTPIPIQTITAAPATTTTATAAVLTTVPVPVPVPSRKRKGMSSEDDPNFLHVAIETTSTYEKSAG